MGLPRSSRYVIIGAGIHGLSTAWNLARGLRLAGHGSGADVVVIDKTGVGAGASGIACGVVRNNYFQPAMRGLMAHSVNVWESDAAAFAYHPVGYLQFLEAFYKVAAEGPKFDFANISLVLAFVLEVEGRLVIRRHVGHEPDGYIPHLGVIYQVRQESFHGLGQGEGVRGHG